MIGNRAGGQQGDLECRLSRSLSLTRGSDEQCASDRGDLEASPDRARKRARARMCASTGRTLAGARTACAATVVAAATMWPVHHCGELRLTVMIIPSISCDDHEMAR